MIEISAKAMVVFDVLPVILSSAELLFCLFVAFGTNIHFKMSLYQTQAR